MVHWSNLSDNSDNTIFSSNVKSVVISDTSDFHHGIHFSKFREESQSAMRLTFCFPDLTYNITAHTLLRRMIEQIRVRDPKWLPLACTGMSGNKQ